MGYFLTYYPGRLGVICFIIYLIMLFRGRLAFKGPVSHSNRFWFVFFGMALYSVFGFLEWDTYHYYSIYNEITLLGVHDTLEPFFEWLAIHLPHSFLLWRLVIWGTSSLLMVFSARLLGLNSNVVCFMTPILFLPQLAVSRAALGLSLLVFCFILLVQSWEKRKGVLIVISCLGIIASNYLHMSMLFFIVILFISFLIPLNKKTVVVSIIAFPVLYIVALSFLQQFISFVGFNDEQLQWVTMYQSAEKMSLNINGIIMTLFEKTMLLLLLYTMVNKYLFVKIDTSKAQLGLFKYAYFLIYVSFLFFGQETSNWISNRTLHAASFTLILCASHCFDVKSVGIRRSSVEKIILLGYMFYTIWKQCSFMSAHWNNYILF